MHDRAAGGLIPSVRARTWTFVLVALWTGALAVLASPASAQRWGRGWSRRAPMANPGEAAEFGFTFCRIAYRSVRNEALGQGWRTDYPNSDANFALRFSQLTTSAVSRSEDGEPFYAVVTLDDDQIFQCPFVFMSDVGTVGFDADEIERLRTYLLKGGFLYVDDFWGDRAWQHWEQTMREVLPDHVIQDVPSDHLLLNGLYQVRNVPQVPSIQYWYRTGRQATSERGFESAEVHFRAIFDEEGRAMVVMTHNTDIADGWEREGEDESFFFRFSPESYALGINIVLYALTH